MQTSISNNQFVPLLSRQPAGLSLSANSKKTAEITNICGSIFAALKQYSGIILSGLYGLSCDLLNGNCVFSIWSATFKVGLILATLRLFPARILIHFPSSIALAGAYLSDFLTGNPKLLIDLIRLGLDVNCVTVGGYTPLHIAVVTNNTEAARLLIAAGAKIESHGKSPLYFSENNIQMVRILTETESNPAFDSCKDIHDFFEKVFPSSPDLPENWKAIICKVPKSPLIKILEQENQSTDQTSEEMLFLKTIGLSDISADDNASQLIFNEGMNAHAIINLLSQKSSIFAQAWKLANQSEPLKVQECSDNTFTYLNGKHRIHPIGLGACYSDSKHLIRVSKNASTDEKAGSLIFETINAIQKSSFQEADRLSKEGKLNREEYSILIESIEFNSGLWHDKIVRQIGYKPICTTTDFPDEWRCANQPLAEGLTPHAERYRLEWDIRDSGIYISQNKELFQKRCNELATGGKQRAHNESATEDSFTPFV